MTENDWDKWTIRCIVILLGNTHIFVPQSLIDAAVSVSDCHIASITPCPPLLVFLLYCNIPFQLYDVLQCLIGVNTTI